MNWRDVVGFEELYQVSDTGRIWSCTRACERATHVLPNGYVNVILSKGGKAFNRKVHVLVLEAFVGPRPAGHESRHRDNVRSNNTLGNLLWGTKSENAQDKVGHGSAPLLENNPRAVLTNMQALEIYRRLQKGEAGIDLAAEFGVSEVTVSHIACGRTWADVTGAVYQPERTKVTKELVAKMQRLRDSGMTLDEVAKACGTSKPTVFRRTKASAA